MTKKEKIENYVNQIFETLKQKGFTGEKGYFKTSHSGKISWISGRFSKDNFRILDEKNSIRFEIKIGKDWKNYQSGKIFYKKDFPIIPECYLN